MCILNCRWFLHDQNTIYRSLDLGVELVFQRHSTNKYESIILMLLRFGSCFKRKF